MNYLKSRSQLARSLHKSVSRGFKEGFLGGAERKNFLRFRPEADRGWANAIQHTKKMLEYFKRKDGRLAQRWRANAANEASVDESLTDICGKAQCGRQRKVVITGPVDEPTYQKRIQNHSAKPIAEREFPSAMAASIHFGYGRNEVCQALHRARQKGKTIAVVAGVPVAYADEIDGLNKPHQQ